MAIWWCSAGTTDLDAVLPDDPDAAQHVLFRGCRSPGDAARAPAGYEPVHQAVQPRGCQRAERAPPEKTSRVIRALAVVHRVRLTRREAIGDELEDRAGK